MIFSNYLNPSLQIMRPSRIYSFASILNIHSEHEEPGVLPLDLDHAWVVWLLQTCQTTDRPDGHDYSR
jgi:hypothetical protein